MDSNAVATSGESLWIENDEGELVEIVEVKSSPAFIRTPQRLDCTHFKSSVMTYKDGIPDVGSDYTWTCNGVPMGVSQSNIDILKGMSRTKVRKLVVKLPLVASMIVIYGQVSWGFAARSPNAITDINVTLTPCSDFSIIDLNETYNVTYDAGDATGTVSDDEDYTPGQEVTVKPSTGLTYSGYTFSGWNLSKDGTGRMYLPGESFQIYEDTTLYAQWISTTEQTSLNSIEPDTQAEGVES